MKLNSKKKYLIIIKMEEYTCCICLDNIKHTEKPYECNHLIHKNCANIWNKNCPLCKSEMIRDKENDKKYDFKIGKTNGFNININIYEKLWKKNKCDNSNFHKIILDKPYGIVGYCSCGSIQSFNYISV